MQKKSANVLHIFVCTLWEDFENVFIVIIIISLLKSRIIPHCAILLSLKSNLYNNRTLQQMPLGEHSSINERL